jgi:hypothetical protein
VTFSIDGATPESYARYRQRGNFDLAIRTLKTMAEEKRKAGRDIPFLNWRYILFNWNDSDEEMARARALAAEIGVDRLCWEITDHPEDSFSRRFVPGSPDYERIRHEVWDASGLGNAIAGATPRARIELRSPRAGVPVRTGAGHMVRVNTRIWNKSQRPFPAQASYGRRFVRLGAQLCSADGQLLERDYARAWLPETVMPGDAVEVPIEIPAPSAPGEYSLKFDLVSEGIDWFESCGSVTTSRTMVVEER